MNYEMEFVDYLKVVLSPHVKEKRLNDVAQSVNDSIMNMFKEEIMAKISTMTLKEIDALRADIIASGNTDTLRKDV